MAAKSSEYLEGCYLHNCRMYNVENGHRIFPHCKKYSCPLHGWKKAKDLRKYLTEYLENFESIRFWTFTLSSKSFKSPEDHYRVLSSAWRYFVTYLRRDKHLTVPEQKVQYVKVCDIHKSGYFHFHGFFDRFIHVSKIYVLWNSAIRAASGSDEMAGYCYVKHKLNAKKAASYVTKYVVKSSKFFSFRLRYYSKSGKVKLFPMKTSSGKYAFFRPDKNADSGYICTNCETVSTNGCVSPLLEHSINKITDETGKDPPNGRIYYKGVTTDYQFELFPLTEYIHKLYFNHYSEQYCKD